MIKNPIDIVFDKQMNNLEEPTWLQKKRKQALKNYDERRLPRVKWVVNESNKIIKLAASGNSLIGRLLRNMLIRKKGPANVVGWRKLMEESY